METIDLHPRNLHVRPKKRGRRTALPPAPLWKLAVRSLVLGAACLLSGCDGGEMPGAPTIKYGTDQCAVCEMVINDQSCAAAVAVRVPKGREFRLFDDLAELFDYEQEDDALPVLERFVHDYPSKRWIKAEDATYVIGDKIRTPMLSGMVAFADVAAAKAFAEKNGARVMNVEEARLARNAWRDAKRGG